MLPLEVHRRQATALGFDTLPTLTGVAGVDLRPGHRVESRQIQAALRLILEFTRSPMLGLVDLTAVDLSVPQILQVSTSQGAVVTFGIESLHLQLQRWRRVHDFALQTGRSVASLDLSVSNNVPARWAAGGVSPAPRAQPVKPSPYKKKHV